MNERFPITVIMGIVFLVAGFFMFAKTYDFVVHATKTVGQVVAMDHEDTEDGMMLHPVFVFTDAEGIEHRCRSPHGSSLLFTAVGQQVAVLYDAADPKHAEIDSFLSIWFISLGFIGMGLSFFVMHYRWIRKMKRITFSLKPEPPDDRKENQESRNYSLGHYPEIPQRLRPWLVLNFLGFTVLGTIVGYFTGYYISSFIVAIIMTFYVHSLICPLRCPKCGGRVMTRKEDTKEDDLDYMQFFHDCPNCKVTWIDKKTRVSDS
ncbi:MAG TPA: DUF3592 domain-containing protein [Verrucomicrobiae bacterium]|nr:DUF3592 domain-containing protein [Verrucomicrobiae bacterium]